MIAVQSDPEVLELPLYFTYEFGKYIAPSSLVSAPPLIRIAGLPMSAFALHQHRARAHASPVALQHGQQTLAIDGLGHVGGRAKREAAEQERERSAS